MTYPRALRSPVMAMARPRRPVAEIAAVQEAAAAIREETGIASAQGLGREIARRVIDLLLDDTRNDPAALFAAPTMDPINTLAFGEGFGAIDELAPMFWERVQASYGLGTIPEFQQRTLRKASASCLAITLGERYSRQIRENASYN